MILLAAFVASGLAASEDGVDRLVREWIDQVLASDRASLRDYWRFEGKQEGQELELELAHCRRMGWSPEQSSDRCVEFTRERHEHPDRAESLYLRCLRKMWLGSVSPVRITLVDQAPSELPRGAALVDVEIGEHKLRFLHSAGALSKEIGELALVSFDGRAPAAVLADRSMPEGCRIEPVE